MGGEVIPVQGDVATKQGIVEFYDKCTKHLDKVCPSSMNIKLVDDKLDFLVNNAGFSSNWKVQTKMVSHYLYL
jgi:NAD(P)-dependent dehydrogenase (short-subunit alcohol dehydrogenase family)